jgi:hypothetical protein
MTNSQIYTSNYISDRLLKRLCLADKNINVLAVFHNSLNLQFFDTESQTLRIFTLCSKSVDPGPFSIILNDNIDFSNIKSGQLGVLQRDDCSLKSLSLHGLYVNFNNVNNWQSQPEWIELNKQFKAGALTHLLTILTNETHYSDILNLVITKKPPETRVGQYFAEALEQFEPQNGVASLTKLAKKIVGVGQGLTPTGDDFICGVMLAAHLAFSDSLIICQLMAQQIEGSTTTLSMAFLQSAAEGDCNLAWKCFLTGLTANDPTRLPALTINILNFGHSSGGDSLAGFIWLLQISNSIRL